MASPERYLYRCTTDKLTMHIQHIEESGDRILWPVFVGGRDWVLICEKGSPDKRNLADIVNGVTEQGHRRGTRS